MSEFEGKVYEYCPPGEEKHPWKGKHVAPGFDGETLRDKSGLEWTPKGFLREVQSGLWREVNPDTKSDMPSAPIRGTVYKGRPSENYDAIVGVTEK